MKFARNKLKKGETELIKRITAEVTYGIDRFHFKNHTDAFCKRHCNPKDCDSLRDVRHIVSFILMTICHNLCTLCF